MKEPCYVLLVEDNNAHALLVKRSFSTIAGAPRIEHVRDGEEALEFLCERANTDAPALVLLDLRLPKLDGFGVLHEMKQIDKLRNIPVVILSTSNRDTDVRTALEHGAVAYWVKPAPENIVKDYLHAHDLLQTPMDVLLVEDDESHARLIERAFESSNFRANVRHVRHLQGMEAEIALKRPDLLILDYLLPDGRGIDALSGNPELAKLPTVLITSHADESVLQEASKSSIKELVPKSLAGIERLPSTADAVLRLANAC